MRIAISGAHTVGKTTLQSVLADALPRYDVVEEPWHILTADGHVFRDPPAIDDFEAQLACSIDLLGRAGPDVLFDRCPADFLAYLSALRGGEASVTYHWRHAEEAMRRLDLVVYVPIERPDRIHAEGYARLRRRADQRLRQFLMEDELAPSVRTVEVRGPVEDRVAAVLRALD